MQKLNAALAKIGLKPSELNEKSKYFYDNAKKLFTSKLPTVRNEDGTFKPNSAKKYKFFCESCLEEAVIQVEESGNPNPPAGGGADDEAEKKKQQQQQQQRQQQPPKGTGQQQQQQQKQNPPRKKSSGFFGFNIFGD